MRTSRINVTNIRKGHVNGALGQIKPEGCVTYNPIASIGSQTGITADHRSGPRRIAKRRRCSSGITKRVRDGKIGFSQIHSIRNAIDDRIHVYCKSAIIKPAAKGLEVRDYSGLFISPSNIDYVDAVDTGIETMVVCRIRKLKVQQRNTNQPVALIKCLA